MDRGLTGAMLSVMRHQHETFAPNEGAGELDSPTRSEIRDTTDIISARAWDVTEDSDKRDLAEAALKSRADDWAKEAAVGGRTLVYRGWGAGSGPTSRALLEVPGEKPWSTWTVPMSMREVEPGVRLVMEDSRSTYDPDWSPRVVHDEDDTRDDS